MGKKSGNWLSSVKKVFRPNSSTSSPSNKNQHKQGDRAEDERGNEAAEIVSVEHFPVETSPDLTNDGIIGADASDDHDHGEEVDQRQRLAAVAVAEAKLVAAEANSRMIRMAAYERAVAKSREDRAAARIQAVYRGYLARRALRALRGLVRLQALVRGHHVRKQVQETMRSMQALLRAQARARARRLSIYIQSNPNQHHQGKQCINTKRRGAHVLENGRGGFKEESEKEKRGCGDWDARNQSLDAIKMSAQRRHDATARRERALAYAYSCQMQQQWQHDREKQQQWGSWNWLENWVACHQQLQPTSHNIDPTPNIRVTKIPVSNNNPTTTLNSNNTADHDLSEKTVEMDITSHMHSPTADQLFNNRPPTVPNYMAATHSARAKVRDELPIPQLRERGRSRSREFSFGVGADSSSSCGRLSPARAGVAPPVAERRRVPTGEGNGNGGYSPDSSCCGDRTPPPFGERVRRRIYA